MVATISHSLKGHEDIIASGVKAFLDVGNSLMAIRDERLYAKEYDTFEDYCSKRWGFKKTYAYQLIESAVVIRDLDSANGGRRDAVFPENERQARAVAESAPDAKTRAVVWKAAVESAPKGEDGKPRVTAQVVKKAAAAIVGPRKTNGHTPSKQPPHPAPEPAPSISVEDTASSGIPIWEHVFASIREQVQAFSDRGKKFRENAANDLRKLAEEFSS